MPAQVDDCIAKYLWMQTMVQRMAERKKQGLAMPTSMTEVEDQLGENPHTTTLLYLLCPEQALERCAGNKRALCAMMSPMPRVPSLLPTCWRVASSKETLCRDMAAIQDCASRDGNDSTCRYDHNSMHSTFCACCFLLLQDCGPSHVLCEDREQQEMASGRGLPQRS